MKANLTPKTFYILTGVVSAIGIGLLWMTNSTISDQSAHIETLRKELRDEKEVQAELEEAKKRVGDLKFKLNHLEEGVQQFAYIPTMLKELEQFGKRNKVQIIQVKPVAAPPTTKEQDKEKRRSAYEELNVNVKARGSYEDSLRFLQAIKVFPKIVAVRTVSLSPQSANTNDKTKPRKPTLEIELELRAYAFKDDQPETKTATKQAKGVRNES